MCGFLGFGFLLKELSVFCVTRRETGRSVSCVFGWRGVGLGVYGFPAAAMLFSIGLSR